MREAGEKAAKSARGARSLREACEKLQKVCELREACEKAARLREARDAAITLYLDDMFAQLAKGFAKFVNRRIESRCSDLLQI
jgi:predicted RNA-binding Zn ribbon-like protein